MKRYIFIFTALLLVWGSWAQTHDIDVWTVIGDEEIVNGNSAWDVSVKANDMKKEGGVWTLTVKNVPLYKSSACQKDLHFALVFCQNKAQTLPYEVYDTDENKFIPDWAEPLTLGSDQPSGIYNISFFYNDALDWYSQEHYSLSYVGEIPKDLTISVSSDDETLGSVSGGGKFYCGQTTTLKATPAVGCRFVRWSDGNEAASRTITVTKSATYTAYFERDGYTIIADAELVNSTEGWNIETKNNMTLQEDGSFTLTVRVTVEKTGTGCHESYRCAVVRNSDPQVTYPKAVYSKDTYLRTKGTAISFTNSGTYDLTFSFKEGAAKPTVKSTIVETLSNPTYTVTVTSNIPEGGIVTGDGTYVCGTSYTIKAQANSGYCFSKWSDGNTAKSRTLTATQDAEYTAIFKTCGFSVSGEGVGGGGSGGGGGGGSGGGSGGSGGSGGGDMIPIGEGKWQYVIESVLLSPTCGDAITYSVVNDEAGTSKTITVARSKITKAGLYKVTIIFDETTSKLSYTIELLEEKPDPTYIVTVLPDNPEHGTVTGGGEIICGNKTTVKATANPGWRFVKWDNNKTASSLSVTVTKDSTLVAIFTPLLYTIAGDTAVVNGTTAWSKTEELNDMDVNESKIWTLTVKNKLLYKTGEHCHPVYQYAAVKDHAGSWIPSGKKTININTSGFYNITYTYNETTASLTHTLSLVEEVDHTFSVVAMSDNTAQGVVTKLTRTYECGEEVKIKATPLPGNRFVKWNNGKTTASLTYTVEKDSTFIAYFEPVSWTLVGDAEIVNGDEWDPANTLNDMTLKDGVWTITIKDRTLVKATEGCHDTYYFGIANDHSFSLTFPKGIKSGTTYKRTAGKTVPVKHTGRYNLTFTYVDGETAPNVKLDTIELLPEPTFTINVISENKNKGSVSGGGTFECGTIIKISAVNNVDYEFLKWSDGNTNASRTITVSRDSTIIALFKDNVYSVIGEVPAVHGEQNFELNNTDNNMQHVYDWETDEFFYRLVLREVPLTKCHNVYRYRVVHNHSEDEAWPEVHATFSISENGLYDIIYTFDPYYEEPEVQLYLIEKFGDNYSVELQSSHPDRGTVSGGGTFGCDEKATIKATANQGYVFKQWSDGITNSTRTFVVDRNYALTAYFDCNGGCGDAVEMYLGYETTSLTSEQAALQPTFIAYPPQMKDQLPKMDCGGGQYDDDDDTPDLLQGVFSVAKTKTVRFSKGNLEYMPTQNKYRFAPNQTDMPPVEENYFNLNNYPGWTQYFNWSNEKFWSLGADSDKWRMLTRTELNYLLNSRTNYSKLRTTVTVEGTRGVVIFPNGYTYAEDFKLTMNNTSYTTNTLSLSQWKRLEAKGAVFFPASGYLSFYGYDNSHYQNDYNYVGYYWVNTTYDADYAYYWYFPWYISTYYYADKTEPRCIRLVMDNE